MYTFFYVQKLYVGQGCVAIEREGTLVHYFWIRGVFLDTAI